MVALADGGDQRDAVALHHAGEAARDVGDSVASPVTSVATSRLPATSRNDCALLTLTLLQPDWAPLASAAAMLTALAAPDRRMPAGVTAPPAASDRSRMPNVISGLNAMVAPDAGYDWHSFAR